MINQSAGASSVHAGHRWARHPCFLLALSTMKACCIAFGGWNCCGILVFEGLKKSAQFCKHVYAAVCPPAPAPTQYPPVLLGRALGMLADCMTLLQICLILESRKWMTYDLRLREENDELSRRIAHFELGGGDDADADDSKVHRKPQPRPGPSLHADDDDELLDQVRGGRMCFLPLAGAPLASATGGQQGANAATGVGRLPMARTDLVCLLGPKALACAHHHDLVQ